MHMGKNRLEAFSDGVLAIIITIMVLEMKVPHGEDIEALWPLLPVFLSYILSFVYVGIYWIKSSSPVLRGTARRRTGSLGKSTSVVLAIAIPLLHGLGG